MSHAGTEPQRILLHICCGPCSLYCIDALHAAYPEASVTGLYANPNIHPYAEFQRRKESTRQACAYKGIPVVFLPDYDQAKWEAYSKEDPKRCAMCYRVRMELTAAYAKAEGYSAFTSTLFVSPYQNYDLMKSICLEMAEKYQVKFTECDFRPGFRIGQREAREIGLYRQKYCGCIRSLPEQEVTK